MKQLLFVQLLQQSDYSFPCTFRCRETNVFVKPDEQSQTCLSFAMARKRTFKNVFVKPKVPRELAHLDLARTFVQVRAEGKLVFTMPNAAESLKELSCK